MTRDELYEVHEEMCSDALEIMRLKNIDYAHEDDPFRNFRTFGLYGIVVRMSDKIARLQSLVERGLENAVKDEKYSDTLLDLINYSVIFAAYSLDELKALEGEPKVVEAELVEDDDERDCATCPEAECDARSAPYAGGLHPNYRKAA